MNPTRRDFLKLAGAAGLALGLPSRPAAQPAAPSGVNPLPRWRGFNLQYLYRTHGELARPDEDHFRWIAGWGFDFVRMPMNYRTWLKKKTRPGESITPEDAFAVDEQVLALIDDAVSYGEKHGVHVCLCFHHAPGYRVGKNVNEPFVLWRDAATVFFVWSGKN